MLKYWNLSMIPIVSHRYSGIFMEIFAKILELLKFVTEVGFHKLTALQVHDIVLMQILSLFQSSREQLAIAEFARALLVIPKQLAINAAQDSTDLVAKLRAYHNTSQTKSEHQELKWWATDLCMVFSLVQLMWYDAITSLLANGSTAFSWKLHCHWLKGWW